MFPEIMKPLNVVGDIVFQIFIGLLQLLIKLTLTQLTKKELGKQKRTWMTVICAEQITFHVRCAHKLNKFLFYIRAPWLLHFKITADPCDQIGPQQCDLFINRNPSFALNRTFFILKFCLVQYTSNFLRRMINEMNDRPLCNRTCYLLATNEIDPLQML